MADISRVLIVLAVVFGLSLLSAAVVMMACWSIRFCKRTILATRAESRDLSARWNDCLKGMVSHDEREALERATRDLRRYSDESHLKEQSAQLRLMDLARHTKDLLEVAENNGGRISAEDREQLMARVRADLGTLIIVRLDEENANV